MNEPFSWYLGIDWGSATHRIVLSDAAGRIHDARTVPHTTVGLYAALEALVAQAGVPPSAIAVAVETTSGVLVDTLLDRGFAVFAVNPKQLDRFRDRFSAAGAKDDDRDASVLADAVRTDRRAFRRIAPDDPAIVTLRERSRLLEDLQVEEARLTNRLREQLYRVDAGWLTLSPAATDPWVWTVLRDAPHPDTWTYLDRAVLAGVLRAHRIRRWTVEDLLAAVRSPRLSPARGVSDAVAVRIAALIPQLLLIHSQRIATEGQIDQALAQLAQSDAEGQPTEHRDVEILQSLPGVGRVVAAAMLTEASSPLAARDYPTLRAYTGVAPVTKRSGKRLWLVHMRYACKARLRQALYHWARTSLQRDAAARRYYDQLRARGHAHGRALRSVGNRWLRILVAMLKTRTLYDATRFAPCSPQEA